MGEETPSETVVLGVTLAQYAGIQAAIGQGFPTDQALRNERLSSNRWARARAAWGDRLARDGHGGPLSAAFVRRSVEATEWLGRRVDPLDSDLRAWCAFLGAYAAEPAPATLLRRLGLRNDDVQRLVLGWKTKTDGDAALAKKAAEIAATKPRGVPAVVITEGALRPFPWSPGPLPRAGTGARPVSVAAAPEALPPSPAVPAIEVPSFLRAPAASPAAASLPGPPFVALVAPALPSLATATIGETVTDLSLPAPAAALPFNPGAAPPPASLAASNDRDADARPAPSGLSTGTVMAIGLPARPDVPFRSEAAPPAAADEKPGVPPAAVASGSWDATVLVFELPRSPAVPFRPSAAASPAARVPNESAASPAFPAAPTAANPSTGTALAFELPRGPDVPFHAPATAGPAPALTLEQHASLCAELTFRPEDQAQILSRYRVTSAAKQGLDRKYRDRADRSPAWDTAYRTYLDWLASREKGSA